MELEKVDEKGDPYLLALHSERALTADNVLNTDKGFVSSVTNKKAYYLVQSDPTARLT
jgi:hypothetical protein